MHRRPSVLLLSFVLVPVLLLAPVRPAAAVVTVSTDRAERGGTAKLVFRVANDQAGQSTTKVEILFPSEQPIARVDVKPKTGWRVAVMRSGQAVTSVTWEGGTLNDGEFDEFEISAGPLPDVPQVVFEARQTYASGQVVEWSDPPVASGAQPDRPAPAIKLTKPRVPKSDEEKKDDPGEKADTAKGAGDEKGDGKSVASQDSVDDAKMLASIALALGALGTVLSLLALLLSRRRRGPGHDPDAARYQRPAPRQDPPALTPPPSTPASGDRGRTAAAPDSSAEDAEPIPEAPAAPAPADEGIGTRRRRRRDITPPE